jgi:hypothetical protein
VRGDYVYDFLLASVFMMKNFFHALKKNRVPYLLISGQATVLYGASKKIIKEGTPVKKAF